MTGTIANSTLRRFTRLKDGKPPVRKVKIRKVNPERRAKREAAYQAYMASPTWKRIRKAAIERAGGQCEHVVSVTTPDGYVGTIRCPTKHRLTVHHRTYARFGGDELPEDLQVLCIQHHREEEATKHAHRHVRRTY